MKRAQGITAALVAITATLTLSGTSHSKPAQSTPVIAASYPQVSTQSVDDQRFERDILRTMRASRSRTMTPKAVRRINTKLVNKPMLVVRAVSRSKPAYVAPQKTYVQPSVSTSGSYGWAHSRSAIEVANCESGDRSGSPDHYNGNAHMRGYYSGKWQMNSGFWQSYGGLAYASTPADASESTQDAVAYRGYLARGWQPWECASIMGVR